jgi:uncharacterized protein YjbJ (UPF0337 family)
MTTVIGVVDDVEAKVEDVVDKAKDALHRK